jgi:hypothetical protein
MNQREFNVRKELDKWTTDKFGTDKLFALVTEHPLLVEKADAAYFTKQHRNDTQRLNHFKTIIANAEPFARKKGLI